MPSRFRGGDDSATRWHFFTLSFPTEQVRGLKANGMADGADRFFSMLARPRGLAGKDQRMTGAGWLSPTALSRLRTAARIVR